MERKAERKIFFTLLIIPKSNQTFTLFLFHEGGMVGKRAVKSGFSGKSFAERNFCLKLSSLRPVYPPYKFWVKKKSSKSLNRHTPGTPPLQSPVKAPK
ncbi:MAG: hypothetical protein DRR16_15090 [Candidatus Parabeggiatoa sp. nov. 3]|nr:MAG: hypothetical protein DRR00_08605 [Gammaproteobacteria bacterium]RKZ66878.1 MAG: hypothetical protein DRQ99_08290 [Gammaproteobacteria bacterium]RKZ84312.1 MAG: hypothetical protein DRR16_15090 [Gammaproteobacteria bacterium]